MIYNVDTTSVCSMWSLIWVPKWETRDIAISYGRLSLSQLLLAACGVAHQALEAIEPQGQSLLVQGELVSECLHLVFVLNEKFYKQHLTVFWLHCIRGHAIYCTGCGPVGLLAIGIAKVMGAAKMWESVCSISYTHVFFSVYMHTSLCTLPIL